MLAPGDRLGPYEILAHVGEGGMGVVYRARDPRLNRQVAIKVLPPASAGDPDARERLRREALAIASFDHPYVCKIFDIGEHEQALFLAMEFVIGDTLQRRLRQGRMALTDALHLAGEVCAICSDSWDFQTSCRSWLPEIARRTARGEHCLTGRGTARRPFAASWFSGTGTRDSL